MEKNYLGISALIASVGILFITFGFGYKQIKDANFLNVDSSRIISTKGVSHMRVTSDRAILSFYIFSSKETQDETTKDFNRIEEEFFKKIDKEVSSQIKKIYVSNYEYEEGVVKYSKSDGYELVLDNKTPEQIEDIRLALEKALPEEMLVSVRYTMIHPEEKFQSLNKLAIADAKNQAKMLARESGARLGDVTLSQVGTYNYERQNYEYDTADEFFYSMAAPISDMTQVAYLTYKIK